MVVKTFVHVGHRDGKTSGQIDFQNVEFQTRSERIYDSIPDVVWHPPVPPNHITRTVLDLDADKIRTTPNKVYGMQVSVDDEQAELSYCEAYQRQQEELSHDDEYQEDQEELSYCNAYLENRSFVNTI